MILRPFAPLAALAALALSGCISLLPEAEPAQLYRFGRAPASLTDAPAAVRVPVGLNAVEFPQAARGDRILTANGGAVAYVAEARWAAPAEILFSEALERSFEERARAARLVGRREQEPGRLLLDVDVRSFEARYDAGAKAAPTVVVGLRARVLQLPERTVVAERALERVVPASENRVGAIVNAFDTAVDGVLADLVTWTDATAGGSGAG